MSVAQRIAVRGRLALCFQEIFTATARLRDGRQVPTDAGVFRAHVKQLLATADETARRMGYPPEFVKTSVYATVALLDESMLSSASASLSATWAGRPLQDEIFGDNVAGEAFFQQLQDLLSRQDSPFVADVLEVLLLCLHLGFKGRYAAVDSGELQHYMRATHDKILRVRGGGGAPFAPDALPPQDEAVTVKEDAVQKRLVLALGIGAVGIGLAVGLLRLFSISPGVTRIQDLLTNIGL
jgi:type VI secretion system protein ImpK